MSSELEATKPEHEQSIALTTNLKQYAIITMFKQYVDFLLKENKDMNTVTDIINAMMNNGDCTVEVMESVKKYISMQDSTFYQEQLQQEQQCCKFVNRTVKEFMCDNSTATLELFPEEKEIFVEVVEVAKKCHEAKMKVFKLCGKTILNTACELLKNYQSSFDSDFVKQWLNIVKNSN